MGVGYRQEDIPLNRMVYSQRDNSFAAQLCVEPHCTIAGILAKTAKHLQSGERQQRRVNFIATTPQHPEYT